MSTRTRQFSQYRRKKFVFAQSSREFSNAPVEIVPRVRNAEISPLRQLIGDASRAGVRTRQPCRIRIAAWAAASRATGTRKGEHET
jgi:hypothetical protein